VTVSAVERIILYVIHWQLRNGTYLRHNEQPDVMPPHQYLHHHLKTSACPCQSRLKTDGLRPDRLDCCKIKVWAPNPRQHTATKRGQEFHLIKRLCRICRNIMRCIRSLTHTIQMTLGHSLFSRLRIDGVEFEALMVSFPLLSLLNSCQAGILKYSVRIPVVSDAVCWASD